MSSFFIFYQVLNVNAILNSHNLWSHNSQFAPFGAEPQIYLVTRLN